MKIGLGFVLCLLWGCSGSPVSPLVGNWQLISYCKADTNGCRWVTLPADKKVLVHFGKDGTFSESYVNTKPNEFAFLGGGGGSYTLEGNNIRIRGVWMSSMNGQVYPIAKLDAQSLHLKRTPTDTTAYTFRRY